MIKASSSNPKELIAALDDDLKIDQILDERSAPDGSTLYLVRWEATLLLKKHAPLLQAQGHQGTYTRVDPRWYGPKVSALFWQVDWHDTWEPEEAMHNQPESAALFQQYMSRASTLHLTRQLRADLALTDEQRQGHGHKPLYQQELSLARDPQLGDRIQIDTASTRNPDKDVAPTGNYHIQPDTTDAQLANLYSPSGAFLDSITVDRLQILRRAFQTTAAGLPDFAQQVALLCSRYKDSAPKAEDTRRTKMSNHWATPDEVMSCLMGALHLSIERFASPLNFHPGMSTYFTIKQEDSVFGASHDAFSMPWLGASQANPEYEAADMAKAVRWAIMSAATTDEASLTAFILPDWHRTAYYSYLADPRVHRLITVPRSLFKFKTPDFWRTGKTFAGNPHWGITIFLVANAAGLQSYDPSTLKRALQTALPGVIIPSMPSMHSMISKLNTASQPVQLTKAFKKVRDQRSTPQRWTAEAEAPCQIMGHPQPPAFPDAPQIIYTDGSAGEGPQGACIGAGVYRKEPTLELRVSPCGLSATNTITRAELTAIYAALLQVEGQSCTIATDSLISMFSINNALKRRQRLSESPHSTLLVAIAELILKRAAQGLNTSLIKVKSHVGVDGNEHADRLANQARNPEQCQLDIPLGNQAFEGRVWPQCLKRSVNSQGAPQHSYRTAGNLHSSLRLQAAGMHAKGLTPPGQYHSFWAPIVPELHPSSFGFWRSSSTPFWTKVNVVKSRTGQLWNKNMAYRQKMPYLSGQARATNADCPLCGDHDGISHMLGSCAHPMMKAMYIERHNAAARKILKLIMEGAHGNCYMLADVGSSSRLGNLGALDSRLPAWILTDQDLAAAGANRDHLRPDIMVVNRLAQARQAPPAGTKVWIVEIGYCAATRYLEKLTEKLQQHQVLTDILKAKGFDVQVLPVILGNTGEIFKSSLTSIKQAGADPDRVDRLAAKLSTHAQTTMQSIIQSRRVTERSSCTHRQYEPP